MAILTDQDKQFIQTLKQRGYAKEAAFEALIKVKQARGDQTMSFGERFMQNLKEAPSKIFGEGSMVSKVPIVGAIGESLGKNIGAGVEKVIQGGQELYEAGTAPDKTATERVTKGVEGVADIIGGGLGTYFGDVTAVAEHVPIVKDLFHAIGEGTSSLANYLGDKSGSTPDEKAAMSKSLENLMNLGIIKLAPEASQKAKEFVQYAGGQLKQNIGQDVGAATKSAGQKLYESAIDPNVKEAALQQNYEAGISKTEPRTRAITAAEQGLYGTERSIGKQAVKSAKDLWSNVVEPAVKNSYETITREELFKPLEEKVAKTVEPGRKAELSRALDAIKEEYADPKYDSMSIETAQQIKSGLDEFTPQKAFKGEEIGNAYNQLRNDMADNIRKSTYEKLADQNIKQAYYDYGNLRELEKIGIKARTDGAFKGGFGGFWTSVWSMATTPIKTTAGKILYKVGDALEFSAPANKTVKTFGDYLEYNGIDKNTWDSKFGNPKLLEAPKKNPNLPTIELPNKGVLEGQRGLREPVTGRPLASGATQTVPIASIEMGLLPSIVKNMRADTPKIKIQEELIRTGTAEPVPVVQKPDGTFALNKDGFHRFMAYQNLGIEDVPIIIQPPAKSASAQQLKSKTGK